MKHIKKFASFLLALVMVLAMAIPTYAAEATGSIKINGTDNVSVAGKTFNAVDYQNKCQKHENEREIVLQHGKWWEPPKNQGKRRVNSKKSINL